VYSIAGDDAVSGPLMLDLEHDPLVRLIGNRQGFGDHPVQTGSLELLGPTTIAVLLQQTVRAAQTGITIGSRSPVEPGRS
jgi:hypothetical protein